MNSRERFLRVYANLPLGLRGEIILVLEGQPISWNVAYVEVYSNTEKSMKILEKLEDMRII